MSDLPKVTQCHRRDTNSSPSLCCWTTLLLPSDPPPSCSRVSGPLGLALWAPRPPGGQVPGARTSPRAWTLRAQARCGSVGTACPCRQPQLRSHVPSSLQYMEKLSQLAYHPLKMQSCYEKMEPLRLDGLQQRFDVSSTSVFKQRAQIHMREVGPRQLPQHTPHPTAPSTVPISGESPPLYFLTTPSCANYSHAQLLL